MEGSRVLGISGNISPQSPEPTASAQRNCETAASTRARNNLKTDTSEVDRKQSNFPDNQEPRGGVLLTLLEIATPFHHAISNQYPPTHRSSTDNKRDHRHELTPTLRSNTSDGPGILINELELGTTHAHIIQTLIAQGKASRGTTQAKRRGHKGGPHKNSATTGKQQEKKSDDNSKLHVFRDERRRYRREKDRVSAQSRFEGEGWDGGCDGDDTDDNGDEEDDDDKEKDGDSAGSDSNPTGSPRKLRAVDSNLMMRTMVACDQK